MQGAWCLQHMPEDYALEICLIEQLESEPELRRASERTERAAMAHIRAGEREYRLRARLRREVRP